jgi:tRNA-uridine 2-sulfurtransferase
MSSAARNVVFVGMSGGVDSSVAAYLLKKQGYRVVGVFMRCYNIDGCAERDAEDARRVAEHIGIPFYVWDFEEEYKRDVVRYMIEGYRQGLTPNPDVMCNRQIKFGLFLKKALEAGADYVATGHYVRIVRNVVSVGNVRDTGGEKNPHLHLQQAKRLNKRSDQTFQLLVAKDPNKDQSYFLWTLTQDQLKRCLFPIGDYIKPKVREIARHAGLPTADKKDSQGICFLGKFGVADFLKQHIKPKKGLVVTTSGERIGEHDGAYFYTIGQRHGLNLGSKQRAVSSKENIKAHYVAAKDSKTNTIVVAEGDENPALYKREAVLHDVNFISPINYSLIHTNKRIVEIPVFARVRYRQPLAKAVLHVINVVSGKNSHLRQAKRQTKRSGRTYKLIFDKPVKFVAEGQSAVFYDKSSQMLGGGIIESIAP